LTANREEKIEVGAVGLHYGRGVLSVNAVMVQGKAEPHSLGIYNLFVGVLQVAVPFYIIATAGDPGMAGKDR
jgi:hypothetical protein